MFYYVYILRSDKDGKLYIGFTNKLSKRLSRHRSGKVFSTSWRLPLELVYYEAYLSESDARKREKFFKTGWGRNYIMRNMADTLRIAKNL